MKLTLTLVLLTLVADVALVARLRRYDAETERLRTGMSEQQRERADVIVEAERHRLRVEVELIRRQARADRELNLAVNVDSGYAVLERDGVLLRRMPAVVGPERVTSGSGDSTIAVAVLGQRTVARILGARDAWEVPASAFLDRGLPVPDDRRMPGVLGARAVILNDGTVLYAAPDSGILADTSHTLAGSIRIAGADLRAIGPNIRPGMPVYFFR